MKEDLLRRIRNTEARVQGVRNAIAPALSRQTADLPPLVRVTSVDADAGTVSVRYISTTGAGVSSEYTAKYSSSSAVQVDSEGILARDRDGNLVFVGSGGDSIVPCVITSQNPDFGTYGVSALFGGLTLPSAQLLEFPGGHAMQTGDRVGVLPVGFGWILPTRPRLVKIVSGTNPYTVIESDVFGTTRGIEFLEVWDIAGGAVGYSPLAAGVLAVMYIDYNNNRFLWGGAPSPATEGSVYMLRIGGRDTKTAEADGVSYFCGPVTQDGVDMDVSQWTLDNWAIYTFVGSTHAASTIVRGAGPPITRQDGNATTNITSAVNDADVNETFPLTYSANLSVERWPPTMNYAHAVLEMVTPVGGLGGGVAWWGGGWILTWNNPSGQTLSVPHGGSSTTVTLVLTSKTELKVYVGGVLRGTWPI